MTKRTVKTKIKRGRMSKMFHYSFRMWLNPGLDRMASGGAGDTKWSYVSLQALLV